MSDLGGDTVDVITRTPVIVGGKPVTDALGIPAKTESETEVDGCSFEYTGGSETDSNVNPTELDGLVFMPPDSLVTAADAIRFRGVVHEVQTPPRLWTDELGRPDYLLVIVRHSEG